MSITSLSIRHPALDAQGLEALYREQLGLIYFCHNRIATHKR